MNTSSTNTQGNCPVCLSSSNTHFMDYNECALYRCGDCHSIYVFPYITKEQAECNYKTSIEQASTELHNRLDKKMRRSRSRAKRLKSISQGSNFLDVGSNVGFMVEAARESGFKATGIELDPFYVEVAAKNFSKHIHSKYAGRLHSP
ncbi:MAG: hypothetical protein HON65_11305 [Rhodospirillales bacterium]|jgi:hypothetical protein|nr:hypothetical protein [Rhodospirillales bacterium]